jgi:hypothetical protein
VGRFISRDTWGGDEKAPMSYNAWAFGYANPIGFSDPSGRVPVDVGAGDGECVPENNYCHSVPEVPQEPAIDREYFQHYNRLVPPPLINFIGTDLKGQGTQFDFPLGTTLGTKYTGMCGEASLGAILGLDIYTMYTMWRAAHGKLDPNNSGLLQLAKVIDETNRYTGNHATYEYYKYSTEDLASWGRDLSRRLSDGYYIIAGIVVDRAHGQIQNRAEGTQFYKPGEDASFTDADFIAHWIVITGISLTTSWNDGLDFKNKETRNRVNVPYDKWLRIYNPITNLTEYYWWADLMASSKEWVCTPLKDKPNECKLEIADRPTVLGYSEFLAVKP